MEPYLIVSAFGEYLSLPVGICLVDHSKGKKTVGALVCYVIGICHCGKISIVVNK